MKEPPKLKKLPAAKQQLLQDLLDKNSEGTITAAQRTTLEELVAEAERLMVVNAKRLSDFALAEGSTPPQDAVPVTVWVKPSLDRLNDAG